MLVRSLMSLVHVAMCEDLHFLAMGDWGGSPHSPYTTSPEVNTAKGMDKVAGSLGAKFALALGDNFYDHGLDSVDSIRFDKTFEQCFNGNNLQASNGFTFHVVAGNHDHLGNVQAQIDYSSHSERWSFPSQYYSFSETAPDGATVDIVFIDTVVLSGISDHENFVRGSDLPGPLNATAAGAQLEWLEKTLSQSTADYLIVGGHYPVYSIAEHGPTKQLQPDRFPYFRDNHISAYICGHDHAQEHIDVGDGIQYHVIGSAHTGDSSTAHKNTISSNQLKFHAHDGGGFSTFSVNKQGMVIKHLDASGKVIYTAPTILPRGSSPTPTPTPPTPSPTPSPTPTPTPSGQDTIVAGGKLAAGDELVSEGGNARLAMQASDGNLVLYNGKSVVWASHTTGHPGAELRFQGSDGNLVLYDGKTPLWDSGNQPGAATVQLQNDCNLATKDASGAVLWSLGTSCSSNVVTV